MKYQMSDDRMAWIARATCGHIIAARADDGDATREDFVEWLGTSGAVTIERTTSQAVRDEGFCTGHVRAIRGVV